MQTREILESYIDDYFERVGALGCDELAARQTQGRFASLSHGAAGIAYAHLHVAAVRGAPRLLDGAGRWAEAAWRRRGEPLAFFPTAGGPGRELAAGAFVFGWVGVAAVRVLVAAARGSAGAVDRRLGDFAACCRPPSGSFGLFVGTAGALQATALLHAATGGDPRLATLGSLLADRLAAHGPPLDGRPVAWRTAPGPGLAHGATGVLLAMLAWCRAAGAPPSPALVREVDGLLSTALDDPALYCPRPTFVASVCNGFAGLAFLALEAFAVLGEPRYLDAARRAAGVALGALPPRPDLCCGRAGAAAACLALAAADPAGGWRRRAGELVLSALLCDPGDWEVAGLYGGEAALPCLAADLLSEVPAGGLPAMRWPAGAPRTAAPPAAAVRSASPAVRGGVA